MYQPCGDTVYTDLQPRVRARSKNAQLGLSHTWSKTTNYADNGGGNAAVPSLTTPTPPERSVSCNDLRERAYPPRCGSVRRFP